jgi:deoxyribodipyrimidine photo-lyase
MAVLVPDARSAGLPPVASLAVGTTSPDLPVGGESDARRRLRSWGAGPLAHHADRHDDLSGDTTFRLSPYLHFGSLPPVGVPALRPVEPRPRRSPLLLQAARPAHHIGHGLAGGSPRWETVSDCSYCVRETLTA